MSSSIAKIAVMTGSRMLTRVSQLLSFVLLARALTPEGFGAYGILTSAVFLVGLLGNFGVRQSVAQLIGKSVIADVDAGLTALTIWPFVSLVCGFILWWLNRAQFALLGASQSVSLVVAVSGILFITFLQGVFLGRGDTGQFALAETAPRVLQSLAVAILWVTHRLNIETAILSFAVSFVVVVPYAGYIAFRRSRWPVIKINLLPKMVTRGAVFAISLFLIMLQGRIGLFFLQSYSGENAAGQFFAAQRVSEIFLDIATAAGLVLFSEAARSVDFKGAIIQAVRTSFFLFCMFTVLGIFVGIFASFFVHIVLGKGYEQAATSLQILGYGLGPVAAARIMNSVVSGLGRPALSAMIAAIGVPINLMVCYLMVSHYGQSGAAVGLVAGQSASCVVYVVVCRKVFDIKLADISRSIKSLGLLNRIAKRSRSL